MSLIGLAALEALAVAVVSTAGATLPDGNYDPRAGEILNGRYKIVSLAGTGASSKVFFASDLKDSGRRVAIKIFRKGHTEYAVREFLHGSIFHGGPLIARMHECFSLANNTHACVALEPLYRSLRIVNRPLPLHVIRTVARDLFGALARIHGAGYMHCDVKPDNIMFTSKSTWNVKLIDFSISHRTGAPHSDYTQTRFWRAPDVHLGLVLTPAIDIWSAACVLVELFIGKTLFPATTTAGHFLEIIGALSLPPLKLVQTGRHSRSYFDCHVKSEGGKMDATWTLKPSLSTWVGTIVPIAARLAPFVAPAQEKRDFVDLIERMLVYDPASRLTAKEALQHAFLLDDSKSCDKSASSSSSGAAAVASTTAAAPVPGPTTQPAKAAATPKASEAPVATKPSV